MSTSSNVRVAVRLRPLNSRERLAGSDELILGDPFRKQIAAGSEHCFTYDAVFGPESRQDELFGELARPLLDSFMNGFNCTILAYGQVTTYIEGFCDTNDFIDWLRENFYNGDWS